MIKKLRVGLHLLIGLACGASSYDAFGQADQKMSVNERMANARAAKAHKQLTRRDAPVLQKATPQDYAAPVDKVLKGPNGEVVRTGERGAKFYINKNGNKTYLSSNQ